MMDSKCHLLEQNSLDVEMFCIWEMKEKNFKIYLAAKEHKKSHMFSIVSYSLYSHSVDCQCQYLHRKWTWEKVVK